MRDVQRIAIVDPSDSTREELRNVLLGMESVWLEAECSRYEFFQDVIRQSSPDAAVVSLDSDQAKALQLIGQLAQEVPDLPILAVSARGDGQAILQALRSGAREFLTAPVVLEELLKALQRLQRVRPGLVTNGEAAPGKIDSRVIAVLGSRGGVGCTTLAVNIGACLAQDPSLAVALVDLDLSLGDADVALDLMPDYTLADVALNIDRLDMTFLRRSLSRHSSGLSLLPHPVQLEDASLIREDHLQRLIGLLRTTYTHLLLDLSKSLTPCDTTALRMADQILVVAQLELSSLRNVVRVLLNLGTDPQLEGKVQVVLNRVGADPDITVKKAEETIGKTIFWQVPDEPRTLTEARNQGAPLVQLAPRSKALHSIQGLARAVSGRAGDDGEAPRRPGKWGLFARR
jgi:pilus assembly protein CpaE